MWSGQALHSDRVLPAVCLQVRLAEDGQVESCLSRLNLNKSLLRFLMPNLTFLQITLEPRHCYVEDRECLHYDSMSGFNVIIAINNIIKHSM